MELKFCHPYPPTYFCPYSRIIMLARKYLGRNTGIVPLPSSLDSMVCYAQKSEGGRRIRLLVGTGMKLKIVFLPPHLVLLSAPTSLKQTGIWSWWECVFYVLCLIIHTFLFPELACFMWLYFFPWHLLHWQLFPIRWSKNSLTLMLHRFLVTFQ